MSTPRVAEPIVVAIDIDDTELSERLFASLADAPGLRIAQRGESADVTVVANVESTPAGDNHDATLTPRELETVRWTLDGKTVWEVGKILSISEAMAVSQLNSAMRKLHCVTKRQAALKAQRLGLLRSI